MTEHIRCTPERLAGLVARRIEKLGNRCATVMHNIPSAAVPIIRKRTPKAFGDLRDSIHAEGNRTVVDAPHAGAVEQGSVPHKPDLQALIAWVKLRGMQGLRNVRGSLHGPTTRSQATRVKALLASEVQGVGKGRFSPVDAPTQVAMAIAKGIEAEGTPPHWMVRDSLPEIRELVANRLWRAVRK